MRICDLGAWCRRLPLLARLRLLRAIHREPGTQHQADTKGQASPSNPAIVVHRRSALRWSTRSLPALSDRGKTHPALLAAACRQSRQGYSDEPESLSCNVQGNGNFGASIYEQLAPDEVFR